jgi:hypothetical protein
LAPKTDKRSPKISKPAADRAESAQVHAAAVETATVASKAA